jgi:hypothetical protein
MCAVFGQNALVAKAAKSTLFGARAYSGAQVSVPLNEKLEKGIRPMTPTEQAIADYFADRFIPAGLGNEEAACSIAGINLVLTGKLTDKIPDCMSEVIGYWIIVIQDSMLSSIRNSARWKSLLPYAAGTGRNKETERLAIILDWMWGTVLPSVQTTADERGFRAEWETMLTERTAYAANAARMAASAAEWAARAAEAAARAAKTVRWVAEAGPVKLTSTTAVWEKFDPCGLLERMIAA